MIIQLKTSTKMVRLKLSSDFVTGASLFLLLFLVGVVARMMAYNAGLWNFSPIAALGLFAGYYFRHRLLAMLLPVSVLLATNLYIGSNYHSMGVMLAVYGAFLLPVLLAKLLGENYTALQVTGCALASSLLFFAITNFAHWWFMTSGTSQALMASYVDALPFFRATVFGDLFWSGMIFGAHACACRLWLPQTHKLQEIRVRK